MILFWYGTWLSSVATASCDPERFRQQPVVGSWVYEQQQLGFNYRITDIQAALGLSQLERLEEIVTERNRQLERYRQLLDLPIKLLKIPDNVLSSVHLAVIHLDFSTGKNHRQVFEGLRGGHWGAIALQPCTSSALLQKSWLLRRRLQKQKNSQHIISIRYITA